MTRADIARLFLFVRELPGNTGQRVNAIQMWTGGKDVLNLPWCADFLWMVLDLASGGVCPLPRSAATNVMLDHCKKSGWMTTEPANGDIYFYVRPDGTAHHVGLCTSSIRGGQFTGISGNTSEDGLSDNGDRVAERAITFHPEKHIFAKVP